MASTEKLFPADYFLPIKKEKQLLANKREKKSHKAENWNWKLRELFVN